MGNEEKWRSDCKKSPKSALDGPFSGEELTDVEKSFVNLVAKILVNISIRQYYEKKKSNSVLEVQRPGSERGVD